MSCLLAIETATDTCSVAVLQEQTIVACSTLTRPRAHAENLVPMILEVLQRSRVAPSDLDVLAVSAGPGSYTGLRIGVSTAKGLAYAAGADLVAVSSLEALAFQVLPFTRCGDLIGSLFPARQQEVYLAVYRSTGSDLETVVEPSVHDVEEPLPLPSASADVTLWLVGGGVPALTSRLPRAPQRIRLLGQEDITPSAVPVARLGLRRWQAGAVEDLALFEPHYLKPFVARKPRRSLFDRRFT
ncbi:MAG: tRNA (adenosine(37)-N6)-threonylcarbamoyltransferase complex dimerization subunit type 1 TsaB [Bacteroidetes bacterium]|nr:MAG: tRNA (adenosine(37)-N6)-threonylcarbamoyltransferase complex dimerization subunit type 1 TsaB [Bacteroidota bacterium]